MRRTWDGSSAWPCAVHLTRFSRPMRPSVGRSPDRWSCSQASPTPSRFRSSHRCGGVDAGLPARSLVCSYRSHDSFQSPPGPCPDSTRGTGTAPLTAAASRATDSEPGGVFRMERLSPRQISRLHRQIDAGGFHLLLADNVSQADEDLLSATHPDIVRVHRPGGLTAKSWGRIGWALVRPDGYIASSGEAADLGDADRYLQRWLGELGAARSGLQESSRSNALR